MVLLDDDDRVLLLRASDPMDPRKGPWWELPGGGIDRGESSAEAAARELYEETGLVAREISGPVWLQHVTFDFAGYHFDQHEAVHVGRGEAGEVRPQALEALELDAFEGGQWWPVAELSGLVESGERIIPPWLPLQLPAVLAAGFPVEPIDLGHIG